MQKQRQERRQTMPRFLQAAVLSAGLMLSCAGPQATQLPQPQIRQEHRTQSCKTIREAMRERVGDCKNAGDFGACVFGERMLFRIKYSGTQEVEVESSINQDLLAEAGIGLMQRGEHREISIANVGEDFVEFRATYGERERPVQEARGMCRWVSSIGGQRKLEQLDRVVSGVFKVDSEGNVSGDIEVLDAMEIREISVDRSGKEIIVRIVAETYENCLVE